MVSVGSTTSRLLFAVTLLAFIISVQTDDDDTICPSAVAGHHKTDGVELCKLCVQTVWNQTATVNKTCIFDVWCFAGSVIEYSCSQEGGASEYDVFQARRLRECTGTPTTTTTTATTLKTTTTTSTTTLAPTTTIATTTTLPTTRTPPTTSTSTTNSTTVKPTAEPSTSSGTGSVVYFFVGMASAFGIGSLAYITWRIYKARSERNYQTLVI